METTKAKPAAVAEKPALPVTAPPPPQPAPPPPDLPPAAVTLTQEEMQALGRILYKNLQTKEDLIQPVSRATTFSVEGIAIHLEPGLLTRLKSRCLDKPNFPSWLSATVTRCLHDFAGW